MRLCVKISDRMKRQPANSQQLGDTPMPIVRVEMWPGRTADQKRELAKAITDAVVEIGKAPAEATFVIFDDVPKENWAQAGALASDE